MADIGDVVLLMQTEKALDKALKRERLIKDRSNPLEKLLPDQVKARYRFYPETIYEICKIVRPAVVRKTKRSSALPVLWQVLLALRFFATGSYYLVLGDTMHVSKSSVCRCVYNIAKVLVDIRRKVIKFPNTQTRLQIKRAFYALGGIPNVTGCVDGCLIEILRPKNNTREFISRKGWPAINIQVRVHVHNFL